jgi:large repetitive protein
VAISFTCTGACVSVLLSSFANPINVGQFVAFTATVICAGFTPTGAVTFAIDGVPGTPIPLSGGAASLCTSSLTVGSHTIAAAYSGDGNCSVAASNTLTQVVETGSVQNVAGTYFLDGITCPSSSTCFAVGVNASNNVGVVVPIINGTAGAAQTVAGTEVLNGIACVSSSTCFAVGTGFAAGPSASGIVVPIANGTVGAVQTVPGTSDLLGIACPSPSTCFAAGNNASSSAGAVVPIVNGAAGAVQTVTGTLDLHIACASSSTCFAVAELPPVIVPVTDGTAGAVLSVPGATLLANVGCASSSTCFAVGTNDPSAVIVPITNGTIGAVQSVPGPSGGNAFDLLGITCPSTSTCLVVGQYPTGVGVVVPLTNGTPGAIQTVPDTTALFGIACSNNSACFAAGYNENIPIGLVLTVNQAGAGMMLTSSPNPSSPGQAVTFTATLTCPITLPSGSVTFFDNSSPIASLPLNSKTVPPVAAFTTSTLAPGSHSITATYSGGGGCAGATSNAVAQVVGAAVYGVLLTSSQNPSPPGQQVTFTATPSCPSFSSTGIVTFTIDGVVGSPVKLIGGVASLTLNSLAPGSHSVSASYSGDGNCGAATSAVLMQMVGTGVSVTQPGGSVAAAKNCQALPAAEQQACFGQTTGNLGTSNPTPLPTPVPGSYCTMPDKSREWVPQGIPAPSGCT